MDFHLSDGTDITTDMMRMCDEDIDLKYSSNSEVQLLQLPSENNEISMYVMLPKENDIGTVSSKLDISYLNTLKSDLTAKYIDLYLPKFKLEEKYRLKKNLKNMGMSTAFTSNADFSGINNAGLFITKVIHQSFIEVNEEGTEAAAATAVIMGNFSAGSAPDPIQFKADRPFMFIIEHKESGQILFMGKVEDPTGELG
jgi:serpin B